MRRHQRDPSRTVGHRSAVAGYGWILETRQDVALRPGPALAIEAEEDQLDQVLINLVQNAVDAAAETGGGVAVGWDARDGRLEIWVADEGPGIASIANLFVPFFTPSPTAPGSDSRSAGRSWRPMPAR
jgi:C4-dicarboxylate-specific signal transduction histidine kinase